MDHAFVTYLKAAQKKEQRSVKQYKFAVEQTAKEGRELKESALVNSR